MLAALERIAGVRSAALYAMPEARNAPLTLQASVGAPSKFPDYLDLRDHKIIGESVKKRQFLVQKTLLEAVPSRSPGYLAAYPIKGPEEIPAHLLVVQAIPFSDIKPNTFNVIKTICDWMRFSLAGPIHQDPRHRGVNQGEFYDAMDAALAIHREQAIPSTLVRLPFDFADEIDPTRAFQDLLESLPPTTLLTNSYEDGCRSLLFLLPANADPQVRDWMRSQFTSFIEKVGMDKQVEPLFLLTGPRETPQQLWGKLVAVNQNVTSTKPRLGPPGFAN